MRNSIFILMLFLFSGCTFNGTFQNRERDKNDAEKITNSFYALLQLDQLQEAKSLFSDTFYSVVGKDALDQLISRSNEEYGEIRKDSLVNWQTTVIKGTNARSSYMLVYAVTRTKKNTTETFSLREEATGIKIVGYNISYNIATELEHE